MQNDQIALNILLATLIWSGLIGIWNNWIFIKDDGRNLIERPNFFQFYLLLFRNLFRLVLLRKPLSFREAYPELDWHGKPLF